MAAPTDSREALVHRVLVVDDDPVYRRVLSRVLEKMEGVELVGTAPSVTAAIRRLESGTIDVVTVDLVLGTESGTELLRWLPGHRPDVIPILLTSGTPETRTEVDAILLGAAAFVRKPLGDGAESALAGDLERTLRRFTPRRRAGRKVWTEARIRPVLEAPRASASQAIDAPRLPLRVVEPAPRDVIAIGSSTGGPPVVLALLKGLPVDFPVPILITQHMPIEHHGYFASMLAEQSKRRVALAQHGETILPGRVYVAGYGKHLVIDRHEGRLVARQDEGPPEHNCSPAVDPMFRSVARACGPRSVGVVATGMGSDGALGAQALRERGAPVVVQDQATSVVWGMPGAVVAAGAADAVVPGSELASWVSKWTRLERVIA
jgi:two-component system chemotaxis response regulator CheB